MVNFDSTPEVATRLCVRRWQSQREWLYETDTPLSEENSAWVDRPVRFSPQPSQGNSKGNAVKLCYSWYVLYGSRGFPSPSGALGMSTPRDFIRSSPSPSSDLNPAIDAARSADSHASKE